jgi:hypothetical protein
VLGRDDPGEVVEVLFDEVAEGEHDPRAAHHGDLAPLLERLAGGLDGAIDVLRLGEQHLAPASPPWPG